MSSSSDASFENASAAGLLGSALNPQAPLPLGVAVARAFADRGFELVVFRRDSLYALTVVFHVPNHGNWHVVAMVPPRENPDLAAVDDALYDQVLASLDQWRVAHAV